MDNFDTRYDELMEALLIEKTLVPAHTPPWWGGFVGEPNWWHHTYRRIQGFDTVYLNTEGKKHRLFGPAYISTLYDIEIWFKNDEYHRIGGPAIRHKNTFWWFQEGQPHNLHGPAFIGGGPYEYWIEGRKYSPKEYKKEINRRYRKGLIK